MHYQRWYKTGEVGEAEARRISAYPKGQLCAVKGCESLAESRGWCVKHWTRWRKYGNPEVGGRGGAHVDKAGYVYHYRDGHRQVFEHREVMEASLGRPLLPTEEVHHKNGVRADNRPTNLELWWKSQPSGQRVDDLLDYVVEFHRPALEARLA